jgi:hypothetical protein
MTQSDDFGAVDIATAWAVIEACEHRDTDDGTCAHPTTSTPECHEAVCPLVDNGRAMNELLADLNSIASSPLLTDQEKAEALAEEFGKCESCGHNVRDHFLSIGCYACPCDEGKTP